VRYFDAVIIWFSSISCTHANSFLLINIPSMVLDEHGGLYTFGSGASGALGHGDLVGQEFPVKVMEFGEKKTKFLILSVNVKSTSLTSSLPNYIDFFREEQRSYPSNECRSRHEHGCVNDRRCLFMGKIQ